MVVAAGGSISAEHGIGQMKRDELARLSPPASDVVDPTRMSNWERSACSMAGRPKGNALLPSPDLSLGFA